MTDPPSLRGINKSKSGHYTVWAKGLICNFTKLEKHTAQRIYGEIKTALAVAPDASAFRALAAKISY